MEKMAFQHYYWNIYRYNTNNVIKATKKDISRIYLRQFIAGLIIFQLNRFKYQFFILQLERSSPNE